MRKLIERMKRTFKKKIKYYSFDPELNIILSSVQNDFGP